MKGIVAGVALSCLVVPAAASAQATQGTPIEIGTRYTLQSKTLGQARDLAVHVPPACTFEARCPVLYVLDGAADKGFPHFVGLDIAGPVLGIFKPFVVVGVASVDRINELTFPTSDEEALTEAPTLGGSERFRRFLVDEVTPWVNATLPVSDQSILFGHSLGGLFVLETAFKEPGGFTDYVAISPSLWWDNSSLVAAARAGIARLGGHGLYVNLGDEDDPMKEAVHDFAALLDTTAPADLRWIWKQRPDQNHRSIIVATAPDALRWVLAEQKHEAEKAESGSD